MNMEQTDSNMGLNHFVCGPFWGVAVQYVAAGSKHCEAFNYGLNKVLYYVIGVYSIAKIKHQGPR